MSKLKLAALVGLIFVAGFASGVVGTRLAVRHFLRKAIANPDLVRERIERELDRKLQLDTVQRAKVGTILVDAQARIKALRDEVQPQFAAVIKDATTNITAVLSPEQEERFEKLRAEHKRIFNAQ